MSARTLAPSARRNLADDLAILRDYVSELDAALADRDRARAATALATLAQTVHQVRLSVDPDRQTVAALTRCDGRYAYRPAAAREAESAADPADTTVPDADALPTLVAVPRQAASVRDQDHPAVTDLVDAERLREARRLLEHAERVKAADEAATVDPDDPTSMALPVVGDVVRLSDDTTARVLMRRPAVEARWLVDCPRGLRWVGIDDVVGYPDYPDEANPTDADNVVCSCTPLVGNRHARACELYDGWAE